MGLFSVFSRQSRPIEVDEITLHLRKLEQRAAEFDFPTAAVDIVHEAQKIAAKIGYEAVLNIMREEKQSPESMAINTVINLARRRIACGDFHIYRGVLNPHSGVAVLLLLRSCYDDLVRIGQLTVEDSRELRKQVDQEIAEVG